MNEQKEPYGQRNQRDYMPASGTGRQTPKWLIPTIVAVVVTLLLVVIILMAVIIFLMAGSNSGESSSASVLQEETFVGEEQEEAEDEDQYTGADTLTDGSVRSAYVAIDGESIFWVYNYMLVKGSMDKNGQIYQVEKVLDLPEDAKQMIVLEDELYYSNKNGIFCLDMEDMETNQFADEKSEGSFWISQDVLYYDYEDVVYSCPVSGGEVKEVVSSVTDYLISAQAIYYISEEKQLLRTDLDGTDTEVLAQCRDAEYLIAQGSDICLIGGTVWIYHTETQELEELSLTPSLEENGNVLITDTYLLYESDKSYKYSFEDGQCEEVGYVYIPEKPYELRYGGCAYYSFGSGYVAELNLETLEKQETDAKVYFDTEESQSRVTETEEASQDSTEPTAQTSSDDYDIASNFEGRVSGGTAFMQSDYFYLALDYDDYCDGLWGCEIKDSRTIEFYYPKARESGYGGTVFTIRAYDWGDNEYADYPHYTIAGLSADKKYVAIFPTDVQWDTNDSVQTEEYARLEDFAYRIEDGRSDNPFSVAQ